MKVWVVYDGNKPLAASSSDSWAYAWRSGEEEARAYTCDHCGSEVEVGLYVATFELDEKIRVGDSTVNLGQ